MKGSEVVAMLKLNLPKFTDEFSTRNAVIGAIGSPADDEVNVQTATDHGLIAGQYFQMSGMEFYNACSFLKISETEIQVNMLLGNHDKTNGLKTVVIGGTGNAWLDGEREIVNVINRESLIIKTDPSPSGSTGGYMIDTRAIGNGNGIFQVDTLISSTMFMYLVPNNPFNGGVNGTKTINTAIRVSASATYERILDAYTKQAPTDLWAFAVIGDVVASKSRAISNDSVDVMLRGQQGQDYRQQLVQPVTIYVVWPTSDERAGREARDKAEDMFPNICKSILFHDFSSGLAAPNKSGIVFVNHGIQSYNSAYYIHQYTFEQTVDLSYADTIGPDIDVAFRDITLIQSLDFGTGIKSITSEIDLDEEPLP